MSDRKYRTLRLALINLLSIFLSLFSLLAVSAYLITFQCEGNNTYSLLKKITFYIFSFKLSIVVFSIKETLFVLSNHIVDIYLQLGLKSLIPITVGFFVFLVSTAIFGAVNRVLINKTSTLQGSARWATEKELRKSGLFRDTGIVLGETSEAVFSKHSPKRPNKRNYKTNDEYQAAKKSYDPTAYNERLDRAGRLICESKNAHVLIVGSTRSGKGISTVLPTNFKWDESMIILDPKAEAWRIASHFRSLFSYTFKFDPTNPAESIHYNPLMSIRRGTNAVGDLFNLGYILIPKKDKANGDEFWDNEARKLFVSVAGYVLYCMPPDKKNLKQVYSVFSPDLSISDESEMELPSDLAEEKRMAEDGELNDEELQLFQEKLEQYKRAWESRSEIKNCLKKYVINVQNIRQNPVADEKAYEEFCHRFTYPREKRLQIERKYENTLFEGDLQTLEGIQKDLVYFSNCEDRQLSSVVSTMLSTLHVIADPNVQEVTSRSDFVFEDFVEGVIGEDGKRHPVSLYLCSELRDIDRLIPMFKLFYDQAIKLLSAQLDSEKDTDERKGVNRRYRLLLILDEFRQLGRMDIIERALSISAGYGILCCMVIQSYEHLKLLYQDEAIITDNCQYQVILRVNEESTSAKIERILGKSTRQHVQIQSSGKMFDVTHLNESENISEIGRSLMTSDEIRTMPDDECIIISSGEHPYRAKKVKYYLDNRFKKYYINSKTHTLYNQPKLIENYPHPEAFANDNKTMIGLDREGWLILKGYSDNQFTNVDNYGNEEETGVQIPEEKDLLKEDSASDEEIIKTEFEDYQIEIDKRQLALTYYAMKEKTNDVGAQVEAM